MTEKEINKALEGVERFTLWRTSIGWQANAMDKGKSGWRISIDASAYKAIAGLFKKQERKNNDANNTYGLA